MLAHKVLYLSVLIALFEITLQEWNEFSPATDPPFQPIVNLRISDQGSTWQDVTWDVGSPGPYTLDKFSLFIDSDLTTQLRCFNPTCDYNNTYLLPCSYHTYELTGYYLDGSTSVLTDPVTIDGTTYGGVPGPVQDLALTDTALTWSPPAGSTACIATYTVCVSEEGGAATCNDVGTTSFNIVGEACVQYSATVAAIDTGGEVGPTSSLDFALPDAQPGEVQNLMVTDYTNTSITVEWDPPLENPKCVVRYSVIVGLTQMALTNERDSGLMNQASVDVLPGEGSYKSTVYDLKPCTNYTIDVLGITETNIPGLISETDASTLEGDVQPLTNVTITPTNDSVIVSWGGGDNVDNCLAYINICYVDSVSMTRICSNSTDGGDGGKGNITIGGLMSCSKYEFYLTPISADGIPGPPIYIPVNTLDIAPGPVLDLTVDSVNSDTVDFSYDAPTENPQCVAQYDTTVLNRNLTTQSYQMLTELEGSYTNRITGLEACCFYTLEVRGVSKTGLDGPWTTADFWTEEGDIGPPQNLQLVSASSTTIQITWFQPQKNKFCAQAYFIEYDAIDIPMTQDTVYYTSPLPSEMFYTMKGLQPSTDYNVKVSAVAPSNKKGPHTQGSFSTTA